MREPSILYEDADLLIVNKPSGLVVHDDGRTKEPTLVDWLLQRYPKIKGVGEPMRFPATQIHDSRFMIQDSATSGRSGIVHRLDRDTSGALVVAKTASAFEHLKRQFAVQSVRKEYHAFVYGRVKNDEGVIDRPIARSKRHPSLWSATRGKKGKEREAVTEYRVLARTNPSAADLRGRARGQDVTFLALFPRTGRTHQLRVHLKAINYPVVCDRLYAPRRPCGLGFKRLALHARSLRFTAPSGTEIFAEAPYPEDFARALKTLHADS